MLQYGINEIIYLKINFKLYSNNQPNVLLKYVVKLIFVICKIAIVNNFLNIAHWALRSQMGAAS